MIYQHRDYRSYLRQELQERLQRNPRYSLRSLAVQLGCAPSMLSQVLSGKKGFSVRRALDIALKLGLGPEESEYFKLLVELDQAPNDDIKDLCLQKVRTLSPEGAHVEEARLDVFKCIADWYHLGIVELSALAKGLPAAPVLAKRFGISPLEARTAVDRLLRLGLVEVHADGSVRRRSGRNLFASKVPNAALRRFHEQMLHKAVESLQSQSPQEKVVGSETIAIDPAILPEVHKATERYFDQILALSRRSRRPSEVYHASVQFFRITRKV